MPALTVEKKKFTYEDYLNTPDDKRYELIEGELLMTPSPVPYHQWIVTNIGSELREFIKTNKLGKVFLAPCDVHLDDETILEPDVLFISKDRLNIIGEKNVQGAPDLIVEVLSEGTAYRDLVKKKKLYAKFGVKEYWIVDPSEKTVEIFNNKDAVFILEKTYTQNDILESPLMSELKIKLSEVFEY